MSNQIYSNEEYKYQQTGDFYLFSNYDLPDISPRIIQLDVWYNTIDGLSYDKSTGTFTINVPMVLSIYTSVDILYKGSGTKRSYIQAFGETFADVERAPTTGSLNDRLSSSCIIDTNYSAKKGLSLPQTFNFQVQSTSTAPRTVLTPYTRIFIRRLA